MRASALLHREGAETTLLDAVAASQSGGDLVDYRRHDQLHIGYAQMRMLAASSEMRSDLVTSRLLLARPPVGEFQQHIAVASAAAAPADQIAATLRQVRVSFGDRTASADTAQRRPRAPLCLLAS